VLPSEKLKYLLSQNKKKKKKERIVEDLGTPLGNRKGSCPGDHKNQRHSGERKETCTNFAGGTAGRRESDRRQSISSLVAKDHPLRGMLKRRRRKPNLPKQPKESFHRVRTQQPTSTSAATTGKGASQGRR